MKSERAGKIADLIHRELSLIISREVEFPSGALVTISEVAMSKDSKSARVGINVFPAELEDAAIKAIVDARGEMMKMLSVRLRGRTMPRIYFEADHGSEHAAHIEKLFLESEEK